MTQKVGTITITHARAREAFDYDPITGILTWKIQPKHRSGVIKIGDRAGSESKKGYRWIYIDGNAFQEHRFIWFWMTGESPPIEIDHKDRVHSNNKWDNLRLATNVQNQANKKIYCQNKTGYKGVAENRQVNCTKYYAQIRENGQWKYLGLFETPEAAHARYNQEAKRLYGEFFSEA